MPSLARKATRNRRRPALPSNHDPLVIAHRGASSDVAEHTLPAYLEAIENGADGLECDVRLTRDGHLVCVHDRTLNRTSNGSGVVSEWDLSRLQELDFRSWKHGRPSDVAELPESADELLGDSPYSPYLAGVEPDRLDPNSSQVLTLETLLAIVREVGRPLQLLVETKHPTRYGGLVEKELVRALRRFGLENRSSAQTGTTVSVLSFATVALRRVRLLAPSVPLVLLMDRSSPIRRDGSLPTGVGTAGPGVRALRADPGYVERAHAMGRRVFCWTVDEPGDVEFVSELGVDAIITNRPAAVRRQLSARHPK
jgi:glycerophosphoryl diester phosphodiesterase